MLFVADAQPCVEQFQFTHIAAIHQSTSAYWQSLDDSVLKLGDVTISFANPLGPSSGPEQAAPPIDQLDVNVDLVDEGVDENGKWFQKLRITLKPGGTLADASDAIYGDESHVNDLLELAKQQIPRVQRPQQLQVGDAIIVTVDPTATYVVKDTKWEEADGRLTQILFNGGKIVTYPNVKGGALRLVDFPDDKRAKSFNFKSDEDVVGVNPGSRLVEYTYRPGDTFEGVVRLIYGQVSATALQDFILKTQWTPDKWPPAAKDATRRIVISTVTSWEDTTPTSTGFPEQQIVTNDQYRTLMQRRAAAGIFPLVRQGTGTVYQVQVVDSKLKARDLATLLYGSTDRYLSLADMAGIMPPTDASGKVPDNFDPPMLGRRFEVFVDYADEWFLLGPPQADAKNQRMVTRLTNGTTIEEYDASIKHKDGLQKAMYYPSGYKRITYRPSELTYALLDFGFFVSNGLRSDPNSDVDQQKSQDYAGGFIWSWAPGLPRERTDKPESYKIYDTGDGRNLDIAISPNAPDSLVPYVVYDIWLANPFLTAMGVVFFASVFVFVVGAVLKRRE